MTARILRAILVVLLPSLLVACNNDDNGREPPAVRQVLPDQVRNDRETLVMVVGRGFREGASVTLGTTELPQSTFVNEEMVTAVVPRGLVAGGYPITVSIPGGGSARSQMPLTVLAASAPPAPPPPPPPPPSATQTAAPTPTRTATATPTRTPTATATAPPPSATAPPPTRTATPTAGPTGTPTTTATPAR